MNDLAHQTRPLHLEPSEWLRGPTGCRVSCYIAQVHGDPDQHPSLRQ